MNKQPVSYLQTDSRWKKLPYRVPGETATIGGSGCGPTAAAMAIETLTGRTFTPVDACKWSVDHGYKAKNQGTYYGYFVPQFRTFGIECRQLLGSSIHHKPDHSIHSRVKEYIQDGCWAVALMGPGAWTKGGHFVLVWDWNDKVRINDPASTSARRLNGDPATFKNEVKNYWLIDARNYNKEDDFLSSYDKFKEYMERYEAERAAMDPPEWTRQTGEWDKAKESGIIADLSRPQAHATRAEVAAMVLRVKK